MISDLCYKTYYERNLLPTDAFTIRRVKITIHYSSDSDVYNEHHAAVNDAFSSLVRVVNCTLLHNLLYIYSTCNWADFLSMGQDGFPAMLYCLVGVQLLGFLMLAFALKVNRKGGKEREFLS